MKKRFTALLALLLVDAVGEGRGRRLIDDTQYI